jgi:hypothetical protein
MHRNHKTKTQFDFPFCGSCAFSRPTHFSSYQRNSRNPRFSEFESVNRQAHRRDDGVVDGDDHGNDLILLFEVERCVAAAGLQVDALPGELRAEFGIGPSRVVGKLLAQAAACCSRSSSGRCPS